MNDWNATQYLKFNRERTQPAIDLVNRLTIAAPERVLDIGCGPGNSTQVLARKFPNAFICGVDNSPDMIETAKQNLPGVTFRLLDASKDLSALEHNFDIVFSNACIQWIPNHPQLIREMLSLLRPGGELAIQTPRQDALQIHNILRQLAAGPKWSSYFPQQRVFYNLSLEEYFDLLAESAADFTIWQTTYMHRMDGYTAILEWYRGTGLRPYLNALPENLHQEFEQEFLEQLRQFYSVQKNGQILFPFPRLFLLATAK